MFKKWIVFHKKLKNLELKDKGGFKKNSKETQRGLKFSLKQKRINNTNGEKYIL